MKKALLAVALCFLCIHSQAQEKKFNLNDSLLKISNSKDPFVQVLTFINVANPYVYSKGDSAMLFLYEAEQIAKDNKISYLLPLVYHLMFSVESKVTSNYPGALFHAFEQMKNVLINIEKKYPYKRRFISATSLELANYNIAFSYAFLGNKEKANEYMNKVAPQLMDLSNHPDYAKKYELSKGTALAMYATNAQFYVLVNDIPNAKWHNDKAIKINEEDPESERWCQPYIVKGDILSQMKDYDGAIKNFQIGIQYAIRDGFYKDVLEANYGIAINYYKQQKIDSALKYANNVVRMSGGFTFTEGMLKANDLLYKVWKQKGNRDSTLTYLENTNALREQIFNNIKANDAQNQALGEEIKQRDLAEQRAQQRKILIVTVIILLILVIIGYFNVKRREKERLRKMEEARKSQELEAAKNLQLSMLPKNLPQRADLDIATFIRSSTEVGGDYYDFFPQKEGILYSICGDATGHGVASGMMVAVTKAGLNGTYPVRPNKVLKQLNGIVKRIDLGTLRMSLNIVEIENEQVHLSSAGMPPVYYYNAAEGTVEELLIHGLPLGGLRQEEFDMHSRSFKSGDFIIQISDGLPEAPNRKGDLYNYDRLHSLIESCANKSAKEIVDQLVASVDAWLEGQHNPDDITIVVIKKK